MIAAIHLVGALLSMLLLSTGLHFLGAWIDRRNAARILQDASVHLGRPLAELEAPEFRPEVLRYFAAKYSDDLLSNRLSDFLGLLLAVFNWLVLLIQIAVFGAVAWFSYTEDQANAVYAWLLLVIALLAFAIGLCVIALCKLLTGRFPGQARNARKALAESINRAAQPVA
ncbi:hypothetical protein [Cognatilysobacter terrigena]|uniref:hypothetical protein n=1 Tax=Cognatilysobacter terrigena TaxID=2488749 RepID=UPI00105E611D|nr:hypothetical protein [Lysobacter terrigena]